MKEYETLPLGVQTKDIVYDNNPLDGFTQMKKAGFTCCDFSLNDYLKNKTLYQQKRNVFFDQSDQELEIFFMHHKKAAKEAGIRINQMHMPYPIYVPGAKEELNDYLKNVVSMKSMKICAFLECPYIVVHGFKLAKYFGSEEAEWTETEKFLETLAPVAKELGITICVENLYTSIGTHIVEGPCCDVSKAVIRIDKLNEKYGAEIFGFCFDTGHANLVGLDFEKFITALDKRLKVLHIHDNDGIRDLHQIPFTFTRTRENTPSTDWDGFIQGLRNIHYSGVLSFETAPVLTSFPEEIKQETLGFVANIGKYFSEKIQVRNY